MELKRGILAFVILFVIILLMQFISAFSISSEPIVSTIINDEDKPAIFDFTITNNEFAENFEIYTFERFRIEPATFSLEKDKTETFRFEFYPIGLIRENDGHVPFIVYFKEAEGDLVGQETISLKLVSFENAFEVGGENIQLDSETVGAYFYNMENIKYDNLQVTFSSDFFDDKTESFSLEPYEKKVIDVGIDQSRLKKLVYGTYVVHADVTLGDRTEAIKGYVKILEKSGLSVDESTSGFIIRDTVVKKTNEGNVPTVAEITLKKNIISRLFSSFSPEPENVKRTGFVVEYFWKKELAPAETLEVNVRTNWMFPLLLIIAIGAVGFLANSYFSTHLKIKKKVDFVRTKSNDFALRVTLRVKAKKFMEKISVYDQLPAMSKFYENFGVMPTKVERDIGRLRWDLPHLAKGEEKIFTYILYSKLKVIGKFELPSATGVYEILGKIYKSISNKTFFINEPREPKKIEPEYF